VDQTNVSVSLGGLAATVLSSTATEIQVTVPDHREESGCEIIVDIVDIGYANVGSNTFTFDVAITSVTNASGSKAGDYVTI